jgi:hypothetical protein
VINFKNNPRILMKINSYRKRKYKDLDYVEDPYPFIKRFK